MIDKELNMAILEQLYNIALREWALMEKNITGSFTAREITKHIGKELKWGGFDVLRVHKVSIGSFSCKFTNNVLFDIVARFEVLAGIGSKRRLFVAEEKGEEVGSVTFTVDKQIREICNFVGDGKDFYQYIFIDAVRNCLVATNGYKLTAQPIMITEKVGDTSEMLISAADFKKMCSKMKGKTEYKMMARKEHVYLDYVTKIEFDGILSSVKSDYRYPEWAKIFEKTSRDLCVSVTGWQAVRKFAKTRDAEFIGIKGKQGDDFVMFEADGAIMKASVCDEIKHSFSVLLAKDVVMSAEKAGMMNLFFGKDASQTIQAHDESGTIYIFVPGRVDKGVYIGEHVGNTIVAPQVDFNFDLLQWLAPITDNTSEKKPEPIQVKESDKPKAQPTENKKNARKRTMDDSRKFTFAAVGVKSGDKITFVDGTEVVVAEDNKVAYLGKEYTLSGFCKQFMPEEKRNKSNSYRGCVFFYKDGVKLEKIFKDTLKDKECEAEQVATVEIETKDIVDVAAVKSEPDVVEFPQVVEHRSNVSADVSNTPRLVSVVCAARSVTDWLIAHPGYVTPRERKRMGYLSLCQSRLRGLERNTGSVGMKTVDSVPASDAQVVHTMALPPPWAV